MRFFYAIRARRSFLSAASTVLFLLPVVAPQDAAAGSLEAYLRAHGQTQHAAPRTAEERLAAINDYTAALDDDAADKQLSPEQRARAIYERAYAWMQLARCAEAIPDFTTLIEGSDARAGHLAPADPLIAASYKWRAVCRYALFDLDGAGADIRAARTLKPNDYTIRRMDLEIMLESQPREG